MLRLLQLLDHDADLQTLRSVEHLAQKLSGPDFAVQTRTIGRGGDYPRTIEAIAGLRRDTRSYDLVHAWGTPTLSAAALALPHPILYTPPALPTRNSLRWLRAIMQYRDVQVLCASSTLQRTCMRRGIDSSRCHLIHPCVDFSRMQRRRDPALRAALGLDEDDYVLLLPGESNLAANHMLGVWTAAILSVLDPRWKVLLWGRGQRTATLLKFARRLNQPQLIYAAEPRLGRRIDFEQLLPVADMALITATDPVPTLPIWMCMASGLPIVAAVSYTIGELLEDQHTAVLVSEARPRLLAQRIAELRADSRLQWSITDMARTEAFQFASITRFIDQHRTAYRQAAARQPLEIPEPAAGAGLRFHGRA